MAAEEGQGAPIPVYRIDLGLPPEERYAKLAADFSERMRSVGPVLDELLGFYLPYGFLCRLVKSVFRVLLRRVWDDEQTREIRSVATIAGVDLFLVVALNTLLDCLLGCTSGAVMVRSGRDRKSPANLMHFRTLDWQMPPLRKLLVVLEFVDSQAGTGNEVIARSITYAGFVGCLTGVRPGFSLSLNFRPMSDVKSWRQIFHMIMVVFGFRESISSTLRKTLLSPTLPVVTQPFGSRPESSLIEYARSFARILSPRCYLVFATPRDAVVIQKDLDSGKIMSGDEFIAQANHDTDHSMCCAGHDGTHMNIGAKAMPTNLLGGEVWVEDSIERQDMLRRQWVAHVEGRNGTKTKKDSEPDGRPRFAGTCIDAAAVLEEAVTSESSGKAPGITRQMLEKWLRAYPISNECTHFATIMDPLRGTIVFLERGPEEDEVESVEEEGVIEL